MPQVFNEAPNLRPTLRRECVAVFLWLISTACLGHQLMQSFITSDTIVNHIMMLSMQLGVIFIAGLIVIQSLFTTYFRVHQPQTLAQYLNYINWRVHTPHWHRTQPFVYDVLVLGDRIKILADVALQPTPADLDQLRPILAQITAVLPQSRVKYHAIEVYRVQIAPIDVRKTAPVFTKYLKSSLA